MHRLRTVIFLTLAALLTGCTFSSQYVYIDVRLPSASGEAPHDTATPVPTMYATQEHAPTATPPQAVVGHCWVATGGGNLNVRAGADISYPVVAALANGARIEAVGGAGNWIRIKSPPGWVYDGYVMCD